MRDTAKARPTRAARKAMVAKRSSLIRWRRGFSARGWPQSEQISMVLVRPTLVTMRQPHFVQDIAEAPQCEQRFHSTLEVKGFDFCTRGL